MLYLLAITLGEWPEDYETSNCAISDDRTLLDSLKRDLMVSAQISPHYVRNTLEQYGIDPNSFKDTLDEDRFREFWQGERFEIHIEEFQKGENGLYV